MSREMQFVPLQVMWSKYWILQTIITENEDDPRIEEPLGQISNVVRELIEREQFTFEIAAANDDWLRFKHRILTRLLGETPADEKVIEATKQIVHEMREVRGIGVPGQVISMKAVAMGSVAVSFSKKKKEEVVTVEEDDDGVTYNVPIGGTDG